MNKGHSELVVQWKYRNRGSVNSEHKGPEEQWALWTSGTMGAEDQWNNGHRGPVEQWVQRTSGTVGIEDQRNSGYRGPEEQ